MPIDSLHKSLARAHSAPHALGGLSTSPSAESRVSHPDWLLLQSRFDHLEARIDRAQTHIVQKIEHKDQLDQQRIEAAKVGWSKFILGRCVETFLAIVVRNLPLILSTVISIELASGIAAGPIGVGASLGALLLVMLGVLAWQGYKAFKEYRALKASGALADNMVGAGAPNDARGASAASGPRPSVVGGPQPEAPRMTWRQDCAHFARHAWQRGVR